MPVLDWALDAIVYIGAFLVALTLVTFVHEFGHFQVARWLKIKVDTFCVLGWGRTFLSVRDKNGVKWGIAPFPVGAYVSFVDDPERYGPGPLQVDDPEKRAQARAAGVLRAQSPAAKAAVSFGGPAANFLFSILAFAVMFLAVGRDATDVEALPPRLGVVQEGSAAEAAGLRAGDLVLTLDGRHVRSWGEFRDQVGQSPDRSLILKVDRDGDRVWVAATPVQTETMDAAGARVMRGVLGVAPMVREEDRVLERLDPLQAIGAGAAQTWTIVSTTAAYIGNIFTGKASAEHIAGPAGILDMSGQVAKAAWGGAEDDTLGARLGTLVLALLAWAATLSVAVGIANLLPIPVLDGGHIAIYAIEAARGGRPLSIRTQEIALRAGVVCLLSLFLFASWNDLQRILLG